MNYRFLYIILIISVITSCTKTEVNTVETSSHYLELVNGVLEYDKVPFTGRLIAEFEKGKLKSELFYEMGKKHGSEKYWYENGELAQERYYKKGLKSGIHKAWWSAKQPKFVYHFNNKGEFHGEVKEWYRSGQLYMSFNYTNGRENGSQQLWKMDGAIKANYEVVNGERFGLIGLKKCSGVSDPLNRTVVKN